MIVATVAFDKLSQSGKRNEGSVESRRLVLLKVQFDVSRQHRQHCERWEEMSKCSPDHVEYQAVSPSLPVCSSNFLMHQLKLGSQTTFGISNMVELDTVKQSFLTEHDFSRFL